MMALVAENKVAVDYLIGSLSKLNFGDGQDRGIFATGMAGGYVMLVEQLI